MPGIFFLKILSASQGTKCFPKLNWEARKSISNGFITPKYGGMVIIEVHTSHYDLSGVLVYINNQIISKTHPAHSGYCEQDNVTFWVSEGDIITWTLSANDLDFAYFIPVK